jgi:glyoxylase-like metal-dependent hydrolase (beta-lactamase superfamily II)
MKKILKRIFFGIGIVIGLIVLLLVVYMLRAKSEIKNMSPMETQVINDTIISIKDSFTNLFLIKSDEQYVAIDGGNNVDTIVRELKKMNIDPAKVSSIFLTHTDGDHVAAIKLFTNALVYISSQEEQLLNGKKSRFLFVGNHIDTKKYKLLEDQQILTIGNLKIQGFLTPGHTPGLMCYVINNKYLFTGDALSLKNGKIGTFNEFFNMDTEMANKSISKLINFPEVQYIFTAHHGYTDNYKDAVKD